VTGLREELALERLAAAEHARRHVDLWRAGRYGEAVDELRAHEAAVARVAELEAELEREAVTP
jgi:hypothetical protein